MTDATEQQPMPTSSPEVWPLIIDDVVKGTYDLPCRPVAWVWRQLAADMRERDAMGRAHYGVPLCVGTQVDPLREAYHEALDLCAYTRQQYERTGAVEDWHLHGHAVALAAALRSRLDARAPVPAKEVR